MVPSKQHSILLDIDNLARSNVKLMTQIDKSKITIHVPEDGKSRKPLVYPGMNELSPVELIAYTDETNIPIYVNGRRSLLVQPSMVKRIERVYVTSGKINH